MIIGKGGLTFRSYSVFGSNPSPELDALLEGLEQYRFDGFVADEGRARGWVSLDHLLDVSFSEEKNVRGPYVVFGLRIDQRRVAPALYKAHCTVEMAAAAAAMGREKLPVAERREIRQKVKEELLAQTSPVSRVIGLVWNVKGRQLHILTTSRAVLEDIADLFDRSFELSLENRSPGALGLELARNAGLTNNFNELMPTAFFADPQQALSA